jgi:hypothetical protein
MPPTAVLREPSPASLVGWGKTQTSLVDGASPMPDHDRADSIPWNPRRRGRPGSFP